MARFTSIKEEDIPRWKINSIIDVLKAREMERNGAGIEVIADKLLYKDPFYLKQKMNFFGSDYECKRILMEYRENNPGDPVTVMKINEVLNERG